LILRRFQQLTFGSASQMPVGQPNVTLFQVH
jgi:hypothetical protein